MKRNHLSLASIALLCSHINLSVSPVLPQKASDLVDMINRVIREGLEGLVLKDVKVTWSHPLLSSALTRRWLWQFEVLEGVVPLQDSGSKGWVCVCLLKCVGGVGGHCNRSRVSCEQVKKPTLTEPPFAFVVSLLLASPQGTYEPGKRHWLKVKKDYLNEGAMADTADLVVLGAFYGQGSKGRWPLAPGMVLL